MKKVKLANHETFYPRQNWLYKGLHELERKRIIKDTIYTEFNFKDNIDSKLNEYEEYPTDSFGVGVNMVKSIRYWTKSFGLSNLIEEPSLQILLDEDPHLTNTSSKFIIQYNFFLQENIPTTWFWFFCVSTLIGFDKNSFVQSYKDYLESEGFEIPSEKTIDSDFTTLTGMYAKNSKDYFYPSEFADLNMIQFNLISKRFFRNTDLNISIDTFLYSLFLFKNKFYPNAESLDLDLIARQELSPFKVFRKEINFLFLESEKISPKLSKKIKLTRSAGLKLIQFENIHAKDFISSIGKNPNVESYYF